MAHVRGWAWLTSGHLNQRHPSDTRRSDQLRRLRIAGKAIETASPSALVADPCRRVGDAFVDDDHFRRWPTRFEAHSDTLRVADLRLQAPGVDEAMRGIDHFKYPGDPDE